MGVFLPPQDFPKTLFRRIGALWEFLGDIVELLTFTFSSMTNIRQSLHYHIYLLTIWKEYSQMDETEAGWRFRLEHPSTGNQRGFATLEALMAALQQELAESGNESGKSS
jgi:hypothetical protein